jgi:hypothetical protein
LVLRVCDVAACSYMLHMSVINPLAANATVTRTSNGYKSPPAPPCSRIQWCDRRCSEQGDTTEQFTFQLAVAADWANITYLYAHTAYTQAHCRVVCRLHAA